MVKALRTTARVGPGGHVEVTDPALPEGASVEVVVLLPEVTGDGASAPEPPGPPPVGRALTFEEMEALPPLPLDQIVGSAPSGRTVEEIDRDLRALRDEWD